MFCLASLTYRYVDDENFCTNIINMEEDVLTLEYSRLYNLADVWLIGACSCCEKFNALERET